MPALIENVPPEPPLPEPTWYGKLLCAGVAACAADALTFPVDTAKVRLQVQGEAAAGTRHRYRGLVNTLVVIAKNEGPKKLYGGLVAGLQRQICFASVRIGLYDHTKHTYQRLIEGDKATGAPSIPVRIAAGITTGAMAVFVAQPTDVVKVRLQASPGRYPTTLSAYKSIAASEGVLGGLWKGVFPNAARNGIVNVAEIVCYDIIKETLLTNQLMDDNIPCHFTSAVSAGFCATMVASPVDVVKTRYMNAPTGQYRGVIHCAIEMGIKEGPKAFYKGAFPSFVRLVSWNISMWISFEQLKRLYSKNIMMRQIPTRKVQIAA